MKHDATQTVCLLLEGLLPAVVDKTVEVSRGRLACGHQRFTWQLISNSCCRNSARFVACFISPVLTSSPLYRSRNPVTVEETRVIFVPSCPLLPFCRFASKPSIIKGSENIAAGTVNTRTLCSTYLRVCASRKVALKRMSNVESTLSYC